MQACSSQSHPCHGGVIRAAGLLSSNDECYTVKLGSEREREHRRRLFVSAGTQRFNMALSLRLGQSTSADGGPSPGLQVGV
jgi:hypothetical protein